MSIISERAYRQELQLSQAEMTQKGNQAGAGAGIGVVSAPHSHAYLRARRGPPIA